MTLETEGNVKNYWEGRVVESPNSLGSRIKRSRLTQGLANFLFSVRTADEIFIARTLRKLNAKSVLDVACGSGKTIIPTIVEYTAGVDISGYPKKSAFDKGYDECVDYELGNYDFTISRQVDVVTSINLNAHIPFSSYQQILSKAFDCLAPGGAVILINEYDNDGVSYRMMRRNRAKFDRMVQGMEHWNLENETAFMTKFNESFPWLKLTERKPLIAGLLPSLHYFGYSTERDPGSIASKALLFTDIPVSIGNYVQARLSPRFNKCFTVGYVYEKAK